MASYTTCACGRRAVDQGERTRCRPCYHRTRAEAVRGEKFWARVAKSDGCWEWQGRRHGRGYGVTGHGIFTHRLSWEVHNGPIPDGLYVLHRCDNRICVRPDHLFLGTALDNARDAMAKDRHCSGVRHANGRKTHCKNGHAFDESNTRPRRNGHRDCRACSADRGVRRRRVTLVLDVPDGGPIPEPPTLWGAA